MWYFTWILGLGAALAFGIINVMWLEAPTRSASSTRMQRIAKRRRNRSTSRGSDRRGSAPAMIAR